MSSQDRSFVVWPPPLVREVDPYHFGIATGVDGPSGRYLNPYVPREIDADLDRALLSGKGAVVSAPDGAGTARTVYEALNRVLPGARLLIPRRPGEFDVEDLVDIGEAVLWLDKLGAHWGVQGDHLVRQLRAWLGQPGRRVVASTYLVEPDVLGDAGFAGLGLPVLHLAGDLTPAELDAMRQVYGAVTTTASIGFNPPLYQPAREHVRLLTDDPVGLDSDELGRRGVATALEEQLRDLVGQFPGRSFLVHVDGPWGAGKSTLLRFLQESVNAATGSNRWLIVTYDAWRQSRAGPPWLTLLQAVRGGVRSTRGRGLPRAWFWLRERAKLINRWQWASLCLLGVLASALVLLGRGRHIALGTWGDLLKVAGGLVPVVAALWLVAKSFGHFVSLDSRRSARTFLETRADPMEDLADHFGWLMRRARRPVLLLLVDDLDRCPETFVVDVLDAVQKLMRDRKRAGPEPTLIVVVAADGRWIRASYDNGYSALAGAVHEPGATVGSLFLEKIFQLTVPVPRLSDELRAEYLRDLLREPGAAPDGGKGPDPELVRRLSEASHDQLLDVLASVPPIERVKAAQLAISKLVVQPAAQAGTRHALEPYAALLDPTPRAMKRFVMAYSMLRAVRTAEGSVVGVGPLALWTILRTRWPALADHLQETPEAVRLFTRPADRLPASTPAELAPLFTDPSPELRAVMNHPDGPMDARTIRECSGQA